MRFRLTRAYSIASLPGILAVAVILAIFYRTSAVELLQKRETEANVALTMAFANTVWPGYDQFVNQAARIPSNELAIRPEIAMLREAVLQQMRGLRVVKVKIYDLGGLTVFSTQPSQIGEAKGDNPGFRQALAGEASSQFLFRDQFDAFEGSLSQRNLLASYIPIRKAPGAPVEGVFELYSDLTPLLDEIKQTEYTVVGVVAGLMGVLYLFLLIIVRRGDRIIRTHEAQEHRAQQERIRYLAYHDALTGLPNRAMFLDLLTQAVKRSRRSSTSLGILLLDLDRFKVINDSLGHEAGDQILIETSRRLQAAMREGDVVARMGGDEFALVLENLGSSDELPHVAERLIRHLSEPIHLASREIEVTPSIGIALYPDDAQDAEGLVKDADTALYRAKELGRRRYAFFTEELDTRARERLDLELGLRKAIANDEFVLYYQPRVDAQSGLAVGAEALLRWQRSGSGLVPPDRFIPLLEDTELIVPVGEWVLQSACRQCKAWRDAGHDQLRVSVNLSLRQFRSESLVGTVRHVLEDTGLPAECLELELTESVLAEDSEQAVRLLRELKALGVNMSIDDFGTGYSSLSYLTHFPVDALKIDRAFVRDVTVNKEHAGVAAAIAAMAKSLGLGMVAEGVENEEQLDFLVGLGCAELQGYLFSPPIAAEDFAAYIGVSKVPRPRIVK